MSDIESIVSNYIEKEHLIDRGDRVLAAVSGGADSMCMLCLLEKYCKDRDISLGVIHVNHGFRPEAADEAVYVREFCEAGNIPFFLKEIPPGSCRSSEEEARLRRYDFFRKTAEEQGYNRIALAHNAQDRAETQLFNLFRGSGIKGLIGIRPSRDMYIRPVLCLDRNQIEAYLGELGVSFCTDATNLGDAYSRNRIRHHIIPLAEQINPGSIRHMSEISDRLIEIEHFIGVKTDEAYEQAAAEKGGQTEIDLETFAGFDTVIRTELIRKSLSRMTPHLKDITSEHVRSAERLALQSENGRISLPYGICVFKEYGKLVITNEYSEAPMDEIRISKEQLATGEEPYICKTAGMGNLEFRVLVKEEPGGDLLGLIPRNKYTKWFDYDKIDPLLCIRKRKEADELVIDTAGHKKTVSRLMIDQKIPERIRDTIPVVIAGKDVLWVAGYRESAAFRIDEDTRKILEIKIAEDIENG